MTLVISQIEGPGRDRAIGGFSLATLELDLRAQLREETRTPKQEVLLRELDGFLHPVSGRREGRRNRKG